MIIRGARIGNAKQLASYLLRHSRNENVCIREIEHYPAHDLTKTNLRNVMQLMETEGRAKGQKRTLYHAIIALPEGDKLYGTKLKQAVDGLAANLGLSGHQRVVVEHQKDGRQHFHIVFNCFSPNSGTKTHLSWKNIRQWQTARQLEHQLNLTAIPNNHRHSFRPWELKRGIRSGIDPFMMRKKISELYHRCKTGAEFQNELIKAGYHLTVGKYKSLVLIDPAGHVHGLMRHIEGASLGDVMRKFRDLKTRDIPPLSLAQRQQRQQALRKQTRSSFHSARTATLCTAVRSKILHGSLPLHNRSRLAQLMAISAPSAAANKVRLLTESVSILRRKRKPKIFENEPAKADLNKEEIERAELIAWAFEHGRTDILAQFGIQTDPENFEN